MVRSEITQIQYYMHTLYAGAPLLYMVLCVPLGLATPHESGYGYGYIQAANVTTDILDIV